jgi:hypothetical protein
MKRIWFFMVLGLLLYSSSSMVPAGASSTGFQNHLVSSVILDEEGQCLYDDISATLKMPNGDFIPIKTTRGFFSIDLTGKARPQDLITLEIEEQSFETAFTSSHYGSGERTFLLQDGQNVPAQVSARHWVYPIDTHAVMLIPER